MNKTTAQNALDVLKLLDSTLQFQDWENGDGEEIGEQLRGVAKALEADIAQPVEPVAGQCRFKGESKWSLCHVAHHLHVQAHPEDWENYETRALYITPQDPAAQFKGPVKWAPEEIARGNAGIRWVNEEGVQGRPTDHDVREFLQCTPTAIGCNCEKCLEFYKPAAPEWIAVSEKLLDSQPEIIFGRLWIATEKYGVFAGRYEWRQGRYPHCFIADTGENYGIGHVTGIMPFSAPKPPKATP